MRAFPAPGAIIGYRKNGRPVRLLAGGAPETDTREDDETSETEDSPEGEPKGTGRFYSEEEYKAALSKVRQQEREKLYPQISKSDERTKAMADELKELKAFQRRAEKAEKDRQAAIDAERKKAEEAEMSAKQLVEKRQAEYESRLAEFQAQQEAKVAVMEKELAFSRLQGYIQRRVSEEAENIAPELTDFISGDTEEEVEASIERVKAKTSQLLENMKSAGARQRASMPGVAPAAGTNGVTPLDEPGERQLSAEDISGMGMGEFAKLRERLGMNGTGQGLFRA